MKKYIGGILAIALLLAPSLAPARAMTQQDTDALIRQLLVQVMQLQQQLLVLLQQRSGGTNGGGDSSGSGTTWDNNGSIVITQPNAEATMANKGSSVAISWTSSGSRAWDTVNISYGTGNGSVKTDRVGIASALPAYGSYLWHIPNDSFFTPGTYHLVVCRDRVTQFTVCSAPRSIEIGAGSVGGGGGGSQGGNLRVTVPNGGEQWQIGSLHTVLWTPYDPTNNVNRAGTQVKAYLMHLENGNLVNKGEIIESGKASIHWAGDLDVYGNYPTPGDNYYVKLVNRVTGETDVSDAPFRLVSQGSISAHLLLNGSHAAITSVPAGGQDFTASWTSNASKCGMNIGSTDQTSYLQYDNLPPTGSRSVHLNPNSFGVSLWCDASAPVEGNANDYVDGPYTYNNGAGQSAVQVVSPSGGSLQLNTPTTITWTMNAVNKVSIGLYRNDASYAWIARDVLVSGANGSYTWTPSQSIPASDLLSGAVYKIYVIGYRPDGTGTVEDKSDAPFSVMGSTVAPARTLPVTGLTATAGNGQVTLNWSQPAGSTSVRGYGIYSSTNPSVPLIGISTGMTQAYWPYKSADTRSFTVTGLTNGTTYYFSIFTIGADDASQNSSPVTVSATPVISTVITPTPTSSVTASANNVAPNTPVTLTWNTTDAQGCHFQDDGYTNVGTSGTKVVTPSTTTTYTFYCWTYAGGYKEADASVTVTVTPTAQTRALPVTGVATSTTSNSVTVSWQQPAGDTLVRYYAVYLSTNPNVPLDGSQNSSGYLSVGAHSYTFTGLTANTQYYLKIFAIGPNDGSQNSGAVPSSAKTLP